LDFVYNTIITGEEAEEYSKSKSAWAIANIEQGVGWPDKTLIVSFRGKKLLFLPEDETLVPCIATKVDRANSSEEGIELITHYLSTLTWAEGRPIKVKEWTSGGPHPFRMAKNSTIRLISGNIDQEYFPDPIEPEKRLALALYREAISLDHTAYSFLSYYKIINLKFPNASGQKKWIEYNISNVNDSYAVERREELVKSVDSISEYLYVSCRCAIAHAGTEPTVDPENYEDLKRLNKDLPLIKNLAELLIETEFGIKTRRTIDREHLYELYGFKGIFDGTLITEIKKLNKPQNETINITLTISIRIKGKENYSIFESLAVEDANTIGTDGQVHLTCVSRDSLVKLYLHLDFANERLIHDFINECYIYDDGEYTAAEYAADYYRFLLDLFSNGHLTIWNTETNECLSQMNAFIPENIDPDRTFQNFLKLEESFRKESQKRKDRKPLTTAATNAKSE